MTSFCFNDTATTERYTLARRDALPISGTFVQTIQSRQGMLVGSPAEVAFRNKFINADQLRAHAKKMGKTELGRLLLELADHAS